jgi:hypothetical protein
MTAPIYILLGLQSAGVHVPHDKWCEAMEWAKGKQAAEDEKVAAALAKLKAEREACRREMGIIKEAAE